MVSLKGQLSVNTFLIEMTQLSSKTTMGTIEWGSKQSPVDNTGMINLRPNLPKPKSTGDITPPINNCSFVQSSAEEISVDTTSRPLYPRPQPCPRPPCVSTDGNSPSLFE